MKKALPALCGALALLLTGCSSAPDAEIMDSAAAVEEAVVQKLCSDSTCIGTISAEGTAGIVTMISHSALLDAGGELAETAETVFRDKRNLFAAFRTYCWAVNCGILDGRIGAF